MVSPGLTFAGSLGRRKGVPRAAGVAREKASQSGYAGILRDHGKLPFSP